MNEKHIKKLEWGFPNLEKGREQKIKFEFGEPATKPL
jgi:hypothetical protein